MTKLDFLVWCPIMGAGATPDAGERHQQLESSRLMFEQAEYLLNDEIGYAESLRQTRRTLSGLVAVIVGIGVFRIDLFGKTGEALDTPPSLAVGICAPISIAAILVLLGLWMLYTDRPPGYEKKHAEEHEYPALEKGKGTAALAILDLHQRFWKILQNADPVLTLRAKTLILGVAYRRLAKANRRVRNRIDRGRTLIFWALVIVFLAFLTYIWSVSIRGFEDASRSGQPAAKADNPAAIT